MWIRGGEDGTREMDRAKVLTLHKVVVGKVMVYIPSISAIPDNRARNGP